MKLRNILKKAGVALSTGIITCALAAPAVADNGMYGETRINELPNKGKSANALWVGSWWAYKKNGIAYRHKLNDPEYRAQCEGITAEMPPKDVVEAGKTFCLSAPEKIDYLKDRLPDNEAWEAIKTYQDTTQEEISPKQEELQDLVPLLNKWIRDNPGEDWRDTDDGKRYLELSEEVDELKADLPEVDTSSATGWEHIEHGLGVAGVGGWWGHCNAWAAASTDTEEPRYDAEVTVDGKTVTFTPGEVKALITEAYMEIRSSFFGSRHGGKDNEGVSYDDVSPAGFHIFFGTQLGNRSKSFIIDRYTGDQVWNQSMRSYVWHLNPLYETDEDGNAVAETVEVKRTDYNRWSGDAEVKELGEREVYPVQVEAVIHWMTDGLPHEAETVDNILVDEYPENHSDLRRLWGHQVEMRHLTYTLWLDKPLEDESARIIGDGEWNHSTAGSNQNHPDFMWQYQSQVGSQRNYENPHIEYATLVQPIIHPASLVNPEQPMPDPTENGAETLESGNVAIEIPDNDRTGIEHTLTTTAASGVITGASLEIDLTHTWRGDLRAVLEHDGESYTLHDRTGGSRDDLKRTFDLPMLRGVAAVGDYTLRVTDHARRDLGTLNSWKLDLEWGPEGDGPSPEDLVEPTEDI